MTARKWKPGDVAMVVNAAREDKVARFTGSWGDVVGEPHWSFADGSHLLPLEVTTARPLAVIDPEDREAVERLRQVTRDRDLLPGDNLDDWQAALREFASPTPPKPDEPTGLGAVVEDADGRHWVQTLHEGAHGAWCKSGGGDFFRSWADITAVRVLSEGVHP